MLLVQLDQTDRAKEMKKNKNNKTAKKGTVFVGGDKEIDFSFMKMLGLNRHYIQSFKNAADIVVDQMPARNFGKHDALLFSVAYLYRHSLELQLKCIIHLGVLTKILAKAPKCIHGHSLHPLWNSAFKVIVADGGWDEKEIRPLGDLILELHKADPTGQEFRYPTKKQLKSKSHTPSLDALPDHVSMTELQRAMGTVYDKLDEIIGGIEAWWDAGRP
jgi:hypothetical protein